MKPSRHLRGEGHTGLANNPFIAEPYVLIVDNELPQRRLLMRWVQSFGYEVIAVADAGAALEAMRRRVPIAVVTDIYMPVHDGLWLLDQIRREWPTMPVVIASAAQYSETILRAKALGADAFVPKPFVREVLYQALRRAVESRAPPDKIG